MNFDFMSSCWTNTTEYIGSMDELTGAHCTAKYLRAVRVPLYKHKYCCTYFLIIFRFCLSGFRSPDFGAAGKASDEGTSTLLRSRDLLTRSGMFADNCHMKDISHISSVIYIIGEAVLTTD